MSELGELLELLYGARGRFRTARGVVVHRQSDRLAIEAMRREHERMPARRRGAMQYMVSTSGRREELPDRQEEQVRFWWQPPHRLREEVESSRDAPSWSTASCGGSTAR